MLSFVVVVIIVVVDDDDVVIIIIVINFLNSTLQKTDSNRISYNLLI